MSSVTETFDNWFNKLSNAEKMEVVLHVVKKQAKPVNEGLYGGPPGYLQKGLFAGPSGTSQKCPCCGR